MGDLKVGKVDNVCQRGIANEQGRQPRLRQQQAPCYYGACGLQQRDRWQQHGDRYGRHQAQQIHAVQLLTLVSKQNALQHSQHC